MDQNFKVGEYIIDFTSIYQITEISGKEEKIVHYKPITGTDKIFTATVPEKNLTKCGLRRLLTAKEVDQLMKQLKQPVENYNYDARLAKDEIYQNIPSKNIPHLKYLWKGGESIPKPDQELRDEILTHLGMEIAFVTNKPVQTVRKEIEKNLNK